MFMNKPIISIICIIILKINLIFINNFKQPNITLKIDLKVVKLFQKNW